MTASVRKVRTIRNGRQAEWSDGLVVRVENDDIGERSDESLLPTSWKAKVTGGDIAYDLEITVQVEDGEVLCVQLAAHRRRGGPPVTARRLREIKLDTYVRHSTQLVARDIPVPIGGGMYVIRPLSRAQREEIDNAVADRGGRRTREVVTDERLEEIATAWRQFRGQPAALEAAARSVNLSRAHFHRLRREAVKRRRLEASEVPTRNRKKAE